MSHIILEKHNRETIHFLHSIAIQDKDKVYIRQYDTDDKTLLNVKDFNVNDIKSIKTEEE